MILFFTYHKFLSTIASFTILLISITYISSLSNRLGTIFLPPRQVLFPSPRHQHRNTPVSVCILFALLSRANLDPTKKHSDNKASLW